jgi:hypothetical protein
MLTLVGGRANAAGATVRITAVATGTRNRRRKVFMSGVVTNYFAPLRVRGSALAGVTMVGF